MFWSFGGYYFDKHKQFFNYNCKDYSFKIDLENGLLLFSHPILSFGEKHLPLDLNLKYNQSHINHGMHLDTGFPRAFKTNYHVFLEYQSSDDVYWYEDEDCYLHIFKLAENSSSLYYDSFGTGKMLTAINGGFKIFDEDGNYHQFDTDGRLIKIHKQVTSNYSAEITIAYCDTSLKISSIADNYGRVVNFLYDSNTSVKVIYLYRTVLELTYDWSSFRLTSLKMNLDNYYPEDYFSFSPRLNSVSLSSGESLSFSYSGSKIVSLQANINQDVFDISYDFQDDKKTTITNARCIATIYDCNNDQTVKQTSDSNSNLSYLSLKSDLLSCLIKDQTNTNNQIIDFNLAPPESNPIYTVSLPALTTNYITDISTNTNVLSKRMYLLCAEIEEIMGFGELSISLFDSSNNKLAILAFNGKTTKLAAPVGVKESLPRSYHLIIGNTAPSSVTIKQVRLVPLIGSFSALCSNVDSGGPVFFYGDEPHYLLSEGSAISFNPSVSNSYTFRMKLEDYLVDERLFRKRSGNTFRFWCNDKTTLIDNVSSVNISMDGNYSLCFNSSSDFIRFESLNGNPIDAIFYMISGKDDNSFAKTKISHDSASFRTGYTNYYYEKEETRYAGGNNGYVTFYDFDSNHSLCEIFRSDGYLESFIYDGHANLIEESISPSGETTHIKLEYRYESTDDSLSRVYKLIDSTVEYVRYYYDDFGLLADIHHPNGLIEKYQYSAATEERLRSVMYQSSNLTVAQYLDDIDSNNLYYGSYGNIYHLTYQNGKLSSVSYNNQEYIWMSYYPTIYNGHVVYDRYYTYTSNSYNFYKEYDAFGRITIDDKLFYEYDDFSNITSIQDTSLNIVNSYTTYQYNYYNDLTQINVQHNGLSIEMGYDAYRRLVNKTYKLNNTTILENDYSYHNSASLEKVIKNTTISIYSSTPNSNPIVIDAFDEVDGFSRISSHHISISGMRTNKLIFYCSGGSDNDLTNFRVKKVIYSNDVIGGPLFGNIILQQISRIETYYYDVVGNITKIENTTSPLNISPFVEYSYDALSRLIRENNKAFNKTYIYSYDYRGNIVSKEEYALTTNQSPSSPLTIHTYTYDSVFHDRLISYDNEPFEYDNMGNPTTYRGKTMSWIRGTLLQSVVDNNNNSVSFVYDGFKQRIRKEANNVTTSYSYINGQLVLEQKGNQSIKYFYAHDGIAGFVLDDVIYFYEKNIQGDVITIRDINRSVVAKYEYDAWGNHIVKDSSNSVNTSSSFVGNINPIRYRSYYYDVDLKMYWLTTRYYDPEIGRFISPDHYSYLSIKKLHGINLYAYSRNNPVMYYDPSGHFWWLIPVIVAAVIVAVANAVVNAAQTAHEEAANNSNDVFPSEEEIVENNYIPGSVNGVDFYYSINVKGDNQNLWELTIVNSYQYTKEECLLILKWIRDNDPYGRGRNLNVLRVYNEWQWHNVLYTIGYKKDSTGTLEAYLNARDNKHGILVGLIFDLWWLG